MLPNASWWQRYDEWNAAIAEEFFTGTNSGSPVYLDLEYEVAERICETIGGDLKDAADELGRVVAGTLDFTGTGNPFRVHLSRLQAWRESKSVDAPPVVALLAFFSLVAEAMVADREFAANNYYGRLARMLGVDADQGERLVDGYRRAAQICWDALNEWLIDWDGELGLPTARALDHRRYVSIAISQALVREHDRLQLARMFEEYGLLPRHAISELEMRQLIQHWVSGGGTGSSIARLWNRGDDVRERVTEIACGELGEWGGALGRDHGPQAEGEERTLPLTLAAELRQHPLPELDLYLLSPGDPTREAGRYALEDGSSPAASLAIEGCEDQLRLEDLQGDGLLSLEPWSQISVGDLLVGSFALRSIDNPARHLRRDGKVLIILAYHEREAAYREISQVPLITRSLVLCRQELAERVRAHLSACARDGFRELGPDDLPGVPEAWVAFADVEVLVARESRGLDVLVPAMDRQMGLVGGLLVGRDTWHEDARPEFQFASAQGDEFRVEIDRVRALDGGGKVTYVLGPFEGACAIRLADLDLPVGDYQIKVRRASGRTTIALAKLRLRSADIPRPHAVVRVPTAAFDASPDATLNPISPEVYAEHREGAGALPAHRIQGAIMTDDIVGDRGSDDPTIVLPREPAQIVPEDATRHQRRARLESRATLEGACAIRGYHFWHCDPYEPGDSRYVLMRQRCNECGLEVWTTQAQRMSGSRGGRRGRRSATTPTIATRRRTPSLPRIEARIAGSLDLILDAISYQRGGSWNQFRQMAQYTDDAPLFAYEAARILSSLGHLELLLDPDTMRPRSYRAAPPTLVEVSGGRLAVAGARSDRLLDALAVVSSDLDLELSYERSSGGLTAIFIAAGSHDNARAAGQLLSEQLGEPVAVSLDFATRAIGAARPISELLPHLPRVRVGSQPAERFDVARGRWVEVTRPDEPGAYRLRWRGTTYAYIDGTDGDLETAVIVDPRTIKHLAARREGASLIGYDAAAQQLIAAPDCELPALLERAAVLCRGLPSQRQDDGRIVYLDVPDHVARGCWRCLSS